MRTNTTTAVATWRKKVVPLAEVVDFNPRFGKDELGDDSLASFIPMKCVEEESGRFEPLGDRKVAEVRKGYTPFRDGDVIFAKVTPCMENGKAAVLKGLTNGVGFGSTEFFALRPKNGLEANYLFHFILQSNFRRDAARNMTGAVGLRRVPKQWLEQQTIPLPDPDEQRRIVAEIEKQFTRLEAGVAALRRVQANLKRYRAAVLKAACEGRLVPTEAELVRSQRSTKNSQPAYDPASKLLERILTERRQNWQGRGQYKEPSTPDTANLPPIPEGWTWARLEQLGLTFGGLTKNPKRAKFPKQLPYLRVANVYANELRLDEIEHIGVEDSELAKLLVRAGDLLIVEGNGSKDQIGRLAIWDGSIDPCVHQNHIIKVRAVEARMPKWILHWLQSPNGRHFVELVASSTSGLYTLSVNKVGDLPIALPPLAEQTRIVAEVERRLSVVEELEAVVSANLQRAIRLRQSILQKAFTGELVAPIPAIQITDIIPPLKPEHIGRPNPHFARALWSAEIVDRLHREPTFGRIKHQKIFHLCEHIGQIVEIGGQYHREAAGPLDNRLIYANEAEMKKQKWFQTIARKSFGHAYQPLAKAGGHRKYLERYWPDKLPIIEKLIELMRTWDTDRCEIFCTAYAAWNDLILWGKQATEANILHEILERWHDSKKRFPPERWRKAIGWMKGKGFIPTGFGKPTRKPE
jgi:type I restriction enzyme S subunit